MRRGTANKENKTEGYFSLDDSNLLDCDGNRFIARPSHVISLGQKGRSNGITVIL